jgi:hypothetical protein
MLWYAIALHWIWGVTLLSSNSPLGVTAIASIVDVGMASNKTAAFLYLVVSVLAAIAMWTPKWVSIPLIIPQSLMLVLSAWGAAGAMAAGSFADGVVRPQAFLVADQAPAILAAIFHTMAVFQVYVFRKY